VAIVGIPLTLGVIEDRSTYQFDESVPIAGQRETERVTNEPLKLNLIFPTSSYSICRPLWPVVAPQLFWQLSSAGRGSSRAMLIAQVKDNQTILLQRAEQVCQT
jgi:hypothetical protein